MGLLRNNQESWYRAVTRNAAQIRQHFGVPDHETEERMVRAFRAALRPRKPAGRKPDDATARAADMWTAGIETGGDRDRRRYQRLLWQRIYREIFPDFHRMDKLTRQYRTGMLRRNVKAFLRRAKGRKTLHPIPVTTRMCPRNRVLSQRPPAPAE